MSACLYIGARAPVPGRVKTRLAATIGDAAAVALYRAFLHDLAARFPDASWFVTPIGEWRALTDARVLEQPDGDWTERQRALFREAAARGEERVVLLASDSPHVREEVVAEAFALLDRHEVVLGPVVDGGYYLLGMRGFHDVLAGVAMSTSSVSAEIEHAAAERGLRFALLEPTYDVDVAADLDRLEVDAVSLPATSAALAQLRLGAAA